MIKKSNFYSFIKSFGNHWGSSMTGIISLPAAITALFVDNNTTKILVGITAIVCFVWSSYSIWKNERDKVIKLEEELKEKETNSPLSIILGTGNLFEKTKSYKLYYLNRTISVAVRNNGTKFISNCKLYIEINGSSHPLPPIDGFTLNPTEEKYIPIISYNEPVPPHTDGLGGIIIHS